MSKKINFQSLYATQDKVLGLFRENNFKFYLSGGTALQRFYLLNRYRYSEDLDFFTLENSSSDIKKFINIIKNEIGIKEHYYSGSSARVELLENNLVIDFINEMNLEKISEPVFSEYGFYIDSLQGILVNKFECIFSRDEPRDIIDIYTILKDYGSQINFDDIALNLSNRTNIRLEEPIDILKNYDYRNLEREEYLLIDSDIIFECKNNMSEILQNYMFLKPPKKRNKPR